MASIMKSGAQALCLAAASLAALPGSVAARTRDMICLHAARGLRL